ncbi:hypothetical protein ACF06X_10095 [Streptomyces sp. NPDC015346]|uniref:hypothetical protein n=1 Tax=Streptomyces sp. NPDC015346 TaxID=3364954 RepID=UPI0036F6210F
MVRSSREVVPVRDRESAPVVAVAPGGGKLPAEVVMPTLKVKKGRIRLSYGATHRSH